MWVDTNGGTRLTLVNSSAGAAGVQAALLAQSHADVLNSEDAALIVNGAPAPSTGAYQTVGDSAALTFQDAGGNLVTVQLPAPLSTVFLADGETVDATAIAVLIAAVTGTVLTAAGGAVTAYVGGIRRRTVREIY